jgi:hypothetical protein
MVTLRSRLTGDGGQVPRTRFPVCGHLSRPARHGEGLGAGCGPAWSQGHSVTLAWDTGAQARTPRPGAFLGRGCPLLDGAGGHIQSSGCAAPRSVERGPGRRSPGFPPAALTGFEPRALSLLGKCSALRPCAQSFLSSDGVLPTFPG